MSDFNDAPAPTDSHWLDRVIEGVVEHNGDTLTAHQIVNAVMHAPPIVNAIQNAIDASAPAEPLTVRMDQQGVQISVEIIDRGCGMSAEFIRSQLFKPFASSKEGGFGIGAFEARTLAAAMNGRLEVESREGEGSRFTLILPVAMQDAEVEPKSKERAA